MNARIRYRCILLALMLSVANMAYAAHSAAHLSTGAGQCEFCVNHTQPFSAVLSAFGMALPDLHSGPSGLPVLSCFSKSLVFGQPQARAPPVQV
jgi:hypothetical protein